MYNLEEFIRESDQFRKFMGLFAQGSPPDSLRCAKIKLTPRCNLKCRMCKYWRYERDQELGTEEVKGVIGSLKNLGCKKVHFSGGEIFLRDDALEILECACRSISKVNLTSNGTLIDGSLAKRLMRLKINSISLSLDGPDSRIHDRIRGVKGSFKRMLEGISNIAGERNSGKRKTKIRINVVLQRENYRVIPQILELAGQLEAVEVKVIPVDGKCDKKAALSKTQIKEFNSEIVPEMLKVRRKYGFSTDRQMVYPLGLKKEEISLAKEARYSLDYYSHHMCYAPWLHTFISWNGNVFLCCMSRDRISPLGNVKDDRCENIFRGESYRNVREELKRRRFEFCSRCDDFLAENSFLEPHMKSCLQGDGRS